MSDKDQVKISVRNLIEFLLRSRNIESGFMSPARALEGSRIHRKIQREAQGDYRAEVYLKHTAEYEELLLTIEGRADGIINEEGNYVIEEIKSTMSSLSVVDENFNILHWAQVKFYGFMFCLQEGLRDICLQLTYCQVETEEIKRIRKGFAFVELEEFVLELVDEYYIWARMIHDWNEVRNNSIKNIDFPFEGYRKGQREMAVAVYKTIAGSSILFAQAPTGIGKTISTLFPSVKAVGEGKTPKIFYLTSKTTTQAVAEEAFSRMKERGLKFKVVTITAKDKICFKEKTNCNPEYCEYAAGHFDRVNAAIMEMLENENELSRSLIEKYAEKHRVCPFEYSLDLSLWADCIICDYNYVFDPNASLKRFFMDKGGDYTFLIDEAHNLVDRAREMFSAGLSKKVILQLKKNMKSENKSLYSILNRMNKFMINLKKLCGDKNYYEDKEEPRELYELLRAFVEEAEELLKSKGSFGENEELLNFYFEALFFLKVSELYDERFVTFIESLKDDVKIRLFCLDPSYLIGEVLNKGKAAVFFSATLLPMDYFRQILGGSGGTDSKVIYLSSPFDACNRLLLIGNRVSTKYADRENSYLGITDYINNLAAVRRGNYMVFFPSYQYMEEVYTRFIEKYPDYNVRIQVPAMTDEERAEFMEFFEPSPKTTNIGFCVLGGVYSEGIDLRDDRLIGVIIIGVGLPQICPERDIIKRYYDEKNNMGFEYAYMYPGMNKVMQAAGRLIRSEKDKGVILLIDERFGFSSYQRLFPKEWFPHIKINKSDSREYVEAFWCSE